MSDARRYAVWPEPRSRSLKGSRPSVPHGTNFFSNFQALNADTAHCLCCLPPLKARDIIAHFCVARPACMLTSRCSSHAAVALPPSTAVSMQHWYGGQQQLPSVVLHGAPSRASVWSACTLVLLILAYVIDIGDWSDRRKRLRDFLITPLFPCWLAVWH